MIELLLLLAGLIVVWLLWRFVRIRGTAHTPAPPWQAVIDDALGAYRIRFKMEPISLEALVNTNCLESQWLEHVERDVMDQYLDKKTNPAR